VWQIPDVVQLLVLLLMGDGTTRNM
jgi:hypothetical protein